MTNTATAASTGSADQAGRLGPAYWRLWSATVVSRLGDALRVPALALLAATVTRDPRLVATVVVAGHLAPLLLGVIGGVYADRWDPRRTMATVDALRAALVAAFAVVVATGHAGIMSLAACAFTLAALGIFFDASAFAVLPSLVPAERLPTANGRLQAGAAVAGGFVGAPAAGMLFAVATALPFAIDAVSFAIAATVALTLRPAPDRTGSAPAPARRSVCREAGDGLRWIWRDRMLRLITALTAVTNMAISGLIAVLVLFALDTLAVPQASYGLFMSTAVLGALAGALTAGRLARRLGTLRTLGWVLAIETLALATLALSRHPLPGALALAAFSAGTVTWNALWAAYGQQRVPAGLLGRVGSSQRMVGLITAPIGAAAAGMVAHAAGVGSVVVAAAILFALVTAVAWPVLRRGAPTG
ncbi:MFS transporter [Micromonospora sp. NPDC049679]|uniref:MFS transporter n=1 Tax=Micromonospora sp. NPDC049679 TaxID=3155920 RepID=UPI0033CDFDAF